MNLIVFAFERSIVFTTLGLISALVIKIALGKFLMRKFPVFWKRISIYSLVSAIGIIFDYSNVNKNEYSQLTPDILFVFFITSFIWSFLLISLVAYIDSLREGRKNSGGVQDVSAPANTLRTCPECKELIRRDARKCKHCGSVVEPFVDSLSTYSEEVSRLATKIYGGRGDISDYINLIRSLNYECVQKGVINTTFDVKVNSQVFNFENDGTFKNWVNENLVSRIVAREEISI